MKTTMKALLISAAVLVAAGIIGAAYTLRAAQTVMLFLIISMMRITAITDKAV